ncbi:hypothetical protein [Mycoplasma sp. P36-A1]|uniref:hypothetical protein n=1 Tax=Mycoplasma sp. P36-A1 TaxID=3252900 RepID=UPI003C2B83FA
MLIKLIKYDMKSMIKDTSFIYLITFISCIMAAIFMNFIDSENLFIKIIVTLVIIFSVIMLITINIVTLVAVIKRFYTNVLKDQGYLTNTLPITKGTLVLSKYISSSLMLIISSIVTVILSTIFSSSNIFSLTSTAIRELNDNINYLGFSFIPFIIGLIVLFLITCVYFQAFVYTALVLGHAKDRNKILFSILYAIIINTILSIALVFGVYLIEGLSYSFNFSTNMSEQLVINTVIWGLVVISAIPTIAYYFITKITLEKRLNLE